MLSTARQRILLPLVATLLTVGIRGTAADHPVQIGEVLETEGQPSDDLPVVADPPGSQPKSQAREKIRQALNGESADGIGGDGILKDVLDVIGQRGSILDGSSLDDRADHDLCEFQPGKSDMANRNALVAEQLLKASRLLHALGDPNKHRKALIGQMRREAKMLLSE
jgi:hypothetical protein